MTIKIVDLDALLNFDDTSCEVFDEYEFDIPSIKDKNDVKISNSKEELDKLKIKTLHHYLFLISSIFVLFSLVGLFLSNLPPLQVIIISVIIETINSLLFISDNKRIQRRSVVNIIFFILSVFLTFLIIFGKLIVSV